LSRFAGLKAAQRMIGIEVNNAFFPYVFLQYFGVWQ